MRTALLWSLVWLPMGLVLGILNNSGAGHDLAPPAIPFFTVAWTVWGAVSGGVFAIVLALAESGRTVTTLSLARTALWGALGCMTLPVAITVLAFFQQPSLLMSDEWPFLLYTLGASATLGAVCAAGTLAAIRRTPADS